MNKITLGIVAALFSASANADYKFIDLHFNGPHPYSEAFAINDLNQVVGMEDVKVSRGTGHTPTLWDVANSTKTYLIEPGDNRGGKALDINNRGDVVITYSDNFNSSISGYIHRTDGVEKLTFPTGMSKGVLSLDLNENGYFIGTTSRLTTTLWDNNNNPIAVYNLKTEAVNDRFQMAGYVEVGQYENTAALFDIGQTVILGKGYDWIFSSRAVDVNNNGQVIVNGTGEFGGAKSFLWDNGTVRSLQSTGDHPSVANSINDFGIVAGVQYVDPLPGTLDSLNTRAVIWDGHNQYNLNDLMDQESKDAGWILLTANDINNNGWVVGEAFNTITQGSHPYALSTDDMLSPIPEPSTYLMLLAGMGLLGFVARKNNGA